MSEAACLARDAADPLAPLRQGIDLSAADAGGEIYLDGNSLGALPASAIARVRQVVEQEWGAGLVRSWNDAGWITAAARIGDRIAPIVGAGDGEVIVADSTSVNLYKMLHAAAAMASSSRRRRIVSERSNFPSDLYIADSVARALGWELVLVETGELDSVLDDRVAALLLTHVNYRTGFMHPMADVTRAAHAAGALVIWDLAHSAGAVPVYLHGAHEAEAADFAVGCGYKYLNGGPGAPAFVWVHPRHLAWMDREGWRQPLAGWLGHAAPFAFEAAYQPAPGIARFVCGTPPILSLAALACGVESVRAADPRGGMAALRAKSVALTRLFIELVEARCARHGLVLASPRDDERRGSQVAFAHAEGGYAMMQALIARGVIGDFREPDLLRFGFTPIYTRFVDVWRAVERWRDLLESGDWRAPRYAVRAAVT